MPEQLLEPVKPLELSGSADPDRRRLRVLIVDDDPVSLAVLQDHLAAAGHDVLAATDATGAVAVLERAPVQVVIADWVMPGVSGVKLCRWVRERFAPRPPHFVMLTVHSEKHKLVEAFDAGVDDFLSKPFDEGELLARLRAWARLVGLQEAIEARHREALAANRELAAANAKLAELATRDELTGLPNRREAMRRLGELWAVAARYDQPLACAMVDIDHFKALNDARGHAFGDAVLRHVAGALRSGVRAADAAFRLGGDEFLVLLPQQSAADAGHWAEWFKRAVANDPVPHGGSAAAVTVSIGLAVRTAAMAGDKDLLEAADRALYAAKRNGRNAVAQ